MNLRPIDHSLPLELLQTRESAMRLFQPLLRQHGLTEQQWRVLRVLAENKSLDATELAERCVLLPPSLTRILKALEGFGLVRRCTDIEDQRRTLVQLTPKGRRKFTTVSPHSEAIYQNIERRFGKRRLSELHATLQALQNTLRDLHAQR